VRRKGMYIVGLEKPVFVLREVLGALEHGVVVLGLRQIRRFTVVSFVVLKVYCEHLVLAFIFATVIQRCLDIFFIFCFAIRSNGAPGGGAINEIVVGQG